ncbi:hypothetical protein SLS55_009015 [Diplodia seriata]|uniref:Uncharacterized protein n=1 Tax=Diplodia seriata TaxID=420778 RepID=A0ABR3C8X4_9PEZI
MGGATAEYPPASGHPIHGEAAAGGGYNAQDPFVNFSSSPDQQETYDTPIFSFVVLLCLLLGMYHCASSRMQTLPQQFIDMSKSTSSKHSRRDISDRSLKSLVPTKATLELLEHIVRVAWDGNLQERLCEVALAIHKDLRSCFHNTTVTYETANRATHIVGEINVTVDCWLGQMRALQESISKINVRRDTPPNFMELPKEVHGKEIKKFRLMLSYV